MIFVLAITMGASIVFVVPILAVKVLLAAIGITISAYIWLLPTKKLGSGS